MLSESMIIICYENLTLVTVSVKLYMIKEEYCVSQYLVSRVIPMLHIHEDYHYRVPEHYYWIFQFQSNCNAE